MQAAFAIADEVAGPGVQALLRDYSCNGYDEVFGLGGEIRPHWHPFLSGFAAIGPEGRQAALESTTRLLRESGIAFNVYADPSDRRHAWRLDLVPVVVTIDEWRSVEAALVQRARLLDAILGDLYGPQRLLRGGELPSAMLFGAPEFVRSSASPRREARRFLQSYACDIARTADGEWVVLGDQVDATIGNGYALASRVALSHGLADLFRACHTRRLAGFYLTLQESMAKISARDEGRVVMLSPGPDSPSYFSHAYLARYLGYTLAEAGDLTVRDNQLYLKTLDGLQRADIMICKTAGHLADPLHLPASGLKGIAGLLEAAKSGKVVLVNRPGAGILSNRAIGAFEEGLCRTLLGEELRLRQPETLWLGRADVREALRRDPHGWVAIRSTARNDPGEPCTVLELGNLSSVELQEFFVRMQRGGHLWIATRPSRLATTPSFDGEKLFPTPYAIRTYVAASEGSYVVLPGGLVRLAGGPSSAVLPNGYGSKDLWVTAPEPESQPVSILGATLGTVHLRRTGRDLLSRSADNLFWLGRYAERAESMMRLLRSILQRLLEDGRPENDPGLLRRLLLLELAKGGSPPPTHDRDWTGVELLTYTLMLEPVPYGLRDCLDQLHRTATLARDQISHDAWRMLNALNVDRRWRAPRPRHNARSTLELLDEGIRTLNAFSGTEAENMTRNWAWRFLEMGRRLERSAHLAELTEALVIGSERPETDGSLRLLLDLGDSFMTYRSRYMMTPLSAPVLDLLILDETNPRGLAYQLRELETHMSFLPSTAPHRTAEQRLLLRLLTAVRLAEITELVSRGAEGKLERLQTLLTEVQVDIPQISDIIASSYFAHAETPVVTIAARRREEP